MRTSFTSHAKTSSKLLAEPLSRRAAPRSPKWHRMAHSSSSAAAIRRWPASSATTTNTSSSGPQWRDGGSFRQTVPAAIRRRDSVLRCVPPSSVPATIRLRSPMGVGRAGLNQPAAAEGVPHFLGDGDGGRGRGGSEVEEEAVRLSPAPRALPWGRRAATHRRASENRSADDYDV